MSRTNALRARLLPEKRPAFRACLACGLAMLVSGCGLVVHQALYEKDREQTQKEVNAIRSQLLAHTQILANHGKSVNEFKLQLRDAVMDVKKKVAALQAAPGRVAAPPKRTQKKEPASGPASRGGASGETRYVRRTYQGIPLNYAGGYREPRGARYPYRLAPGTRMAVLSRDRRGFTRVQVQSGRWKGKKMWVRTRWLTERAPGSGRGES